jgi:galactose-1-phosphate uridylyltransferase
MTMSLEVQFCTVMLDGTIKQVNPLTGMEVWSVPGRSSKPITNQVPPTARRLAARAPGSREDHCNFCESSYHLTPAEKSRLEWADGRLVHRNGLLPREAARIPALFRRIPNLFEIVTIDYWLKNYTYQLSAEIRAWRDRYLADPEGRSHVLALIGNKLKLLGRAPEEVESIPEKARLAMADAFFGGCHELIVARRHFVDGAEWDSQLASSGELAPDEHLAYVRFTIDAMEGIYASNPYVRYVAVFQNWLAPAGASFDHLHRQLVGLDGWGSHLRSEIEGLRRLPNLYNEVVVNPAKYSARMIAENDHAVAFADIGHAFPTIAIYSKSHRLRPAQHTGEEVAAMSDIIHACHSAMGSQISCNEEWYTAPRDSIDRVPWHVYIKWRINTPAGFEGGTRIYINPMSPFELRDRMVPRLYQLRAEGKIRNVRIAEECSIEPNALGFWRA